MWFITTMTGSDYKEKRDEMAENTAKTGKTLIQSFKYSLKFRTPTPFLASTGITAASLVALCYYETRVFGKVINPFN